MSLPQHARAKPFWSGLEEPIAKRTRPHTKKYVCMAVNVVKTFNRENCPKDNTRKLYGGLIQNIKLQKKPIRLFSPGKCEEVVCFEMKEWKEDRRK